MKICIVGEFSGIYDEGAKNVMKNIASGLSKKHEVTTLTAKDSRLKELAFLSLAGKIKDRQFEIVHYIPYSGSTFPSFVRAKIMRMHSRDSKMVMSSLQRREHNPAARAIMRFLKPDSLLVSSRYMEDVFSPIGFKTKFIPNGVDTEKFKPAQETQDIMRDRDKYGIARDKFVVLHVGHMNPGRNIAALEKLQDDHTQVMVVVSTSTAQDSRLIERLRDRGVIVWTGYVENIQEMYQLSDCYVFPTLNPTSCIEIPLSVLEAMACNLPVVSTKFGGLPDMFSASDGLYYVEVEELEEAVQAVKMGAAATNTRDKVVNYSWENVCAALEDLYRELLEEI